MGGRLGPAGKECHEGATTDDTDDTGKGGLGTEGKEGNEGPGDQVGAMGRIEQSSFMAVALEGNAKGPRPAGPAAGPLDTWSSGSGGYQVLD